MDKRRAIIFGLFLFSGVTVPLYSEESGELVESRYENVVYIDGVRYNIHTIERGDTLFSLSQRYGVSVKDILDLNPSAKGIVNIGLNIKIPYTIGEEEMALVQLPQEMERVEESEEADETGEEPKIEVIEFDNEEYAGGRCEDEPFEGVTTELMMKVESDRLREAERVKAEEEARLARFELMRTMFDIHTIESGETLYSISRKYEISVATLMLDNPTLDPVALAIGQGVNIRKEGVGLSGEHDTISELDDYRLRLNMVAPEGMIYHLIERGETLEDLSKEYDMTIREIERLNKMERGGEILEGNIILVRAKIEAEESVMTADKEEERAEARESNIFEPLSNDDTLEIALLLPLSIRNYAMKPFVEFYQGFLLGLEDLKGKGRNIVVNLFNTERSEEAMERIIYDPAYERSNLIIGPVYEENLYLVLPDAEHRRVPVVSPLVNLSNMDSPVLFQMAPNSDNRYDKLDDLFGFERHVTMIYGETNDTTYVKDVRNIMARYNRQIVRYDYRYEHPSVISERERLAAEQLRQVEEEAELWGISLDNAALDSLLCDPSPSDLTPLICNDAVSNLFFILSDNETEVDRILSALASAYTAQVAKSAGSKRNMSEVLNFSVVANPAWRNYKNIDRSIYFRDRVYNFPSYVAGRDSEAVRSFDGRYTMAFDDFPSQYSYRGYDVAMIFGEGMFGDIENNMSELEYTPLQTTYKFERAESSDMWINTNWMRVRYNLDYTLKIE